MKITFAEFIAAMRKNGYKQAKKTYINRTEEGQIISACAYGQAAINLGVTPSKLHRAVITASIVGSTYSGPKFPDIVFLNDVKEMTLGDIAHRVERWAKNTNNLETPIILEYLSS